MSLNANYMNVQGLAVTPDISRATSDARRGCPNLILIAANSQSLTSRWPIWPEQVLHQGDWQRLLQSELGAFDQQTERLQAAGLLTTVDDQLRALIPVYEQCRSPEYSSAMESFAPQTAARLAPFAEQIRQSWRALADAPDWDQVAHNLLLGFWLSAVGSQLLLSCTGSQAAGVIVGSFGKMPGVWLGSLRLRPDLMLMDLAGAPYPDSDRLAQLLRQPELMQSFASADEQGQLIVYGDLALKLLQALSAYRKTSPGPWLPHDYWLTWPVLTPNLVRRIQPAMQLACSALHLTIQELLLLCKQLPHADHLQPVDLGLMALIDLIGLLLPTWVKRGLLPAVERPWLDNLPLSGTGLNVQGQMLKGV